MYFKFHNNNIFSSCNYLYFIKKTFFFTFCKRAVWSICSSFEMQDCIQCFTCWCYSRFNTNLLTISWLEQTHVSFLQFGNCQCGGSLRFYCSISPSWYHEDIISGFAEESCFYPWVRCSYWAMHGKDPVHWPRNWSRCCFPAENFKWYERLLALMLIKTMSFRKCAYFSFFFSVNISLGPSLKCVVVWRCFCSI